MFELNIRSQIELSYLPLILGCLNSSDLRKTLVWLIDWLCWGLKTHQPLWVILCHLPEKGRREIEETVEEMKERDRGEGKINEREETEEIKTFILYPDLLQGQQALSKCISQYQLDAPVTYDTWHHLTTQPTPKDTCQSLAKVCAQSIVNHLEDWACPRNVQVG